MKTAQQLFDAAFNVPRDPRSIAYKAGVLYVLKKRCGEDVGAMGGCPYPPESAESDAWYAGCAEGHVIWREALQEQSGGA